MVEVHQHAVCGIPLSGDVDDGDGLPPHCRTMMAAHDYTEFCCKTGLAVVVVKALLSVCAGGISMVGHSANSLLLEFGPCLAYLVWPGGLWVVYGDGGACGSACVQAEAVMEHLCCLVVLLALGAALWDLSEALALGGSSALRRCCVNTLLFRHTLEDHISPSHSWAECSDDAGAAGRGVIRDGGPVRGLRDAIEVGASWVAYVATAVLYVAVTWGGLEADKSVEFGFRVLDTLCHAGICALACTALVHWSREWQGRRERDMLRVVRQATLLERAASHVGDSDSVTMHFSGDLSEDANAAGSASAQGGPQRTAEPSCPGMRPRCGSGGCWDA